MINASLFYCTVFYKIGKTMFDNICKINSKIEVTGVKEKSLIMIVKNNEVKTKEKYYLLVCRDANQKNKCSI